MMQHDGTVGQFGFGAVAIVADNRATDGGELGSDLMIAPGFQLYFQQLPVRGIFQDNVLE